MTHRPPVNKVPVRPFPSDSGAWSAVAQEIPRPTDLDPTFPRMRGQTSMGQLVLVAVSALTYGLAFAPADLWPLMLVALSPLLLVLHRCRSAAVAALWGAGWALLMTLVVGNCLVPAAELFYERSAAVGWGVLVLAGLLTAVPQYATFAALYHLLSRRWQSALPFLGAAAFAGMDWARTALPPGNPWAIAGYAPMDFLPLVQIADITGAPGISFVLATTNIALVQLWLARGKNQATRSARIGALGSLAAITLTLGYGATQLSRYTGSNEGLSVAVVQPGGGPRLSPSTEAGRATLIESLRQSKEATAALDPAMIVWPESVLAFYPENDALYRRSIAASLAPHTPEILAGGPRRLADGRVANTFFSFDARGEITGHYDKQVLLAFGESFPTGMDGLINRDLGGGPREYAAGPDAPLLPTRLGRAGIAICNETMIPSLIRKRVEDGAAVLVNPTNDAWFPNPSCPEGLFDIARMRAIEQRRWLVRASSSGPSALVEPSGRIAALRALGDRGWIGGRVQPLHQRTLYQRSGGIFGLLCILVSALALGRRRLPASRR